MNICTNLRIYIYPVSCRILCILFVNVIIAQIVHLFTVSKIENILMIIIYKKKKKYLNVFN